MTHISIDTSLNLSAPKPALPPETPLPMPSQALSRFDKSQRRQPLVRHAKPILSRLFVFGGGLMLTGYGAFEMYGVVSVSSVTILQWLLVVLFTTN